MRNLIRATFPILSSLLIFGCGGGGGGQDTPSSPQVDNGTATIVPTPSAPTAGDGNEPGNSSGTEASKLVAVSGSAVKGPLVFAMVTAYQIDGSASDLKGDPVAVGMTDQNAALQLNIPETLRIESIVGAGYPDEQKKPHPREVLQYEKVFHDTYGNDFGKS